LAACVCATSGQLLVNPARAIVPSQSHQFHAQDELDNSLSVMLEDHPPELNPAMPME